MKALSLKTKNNELWQAYQNKKSDNRMLFPTEGAKALEVSEFELLLASPYSRYIGSNCKEVLRQLEAFGEVESIVRNDLAVHEKTGVFENLKLGDNMGIALNVGGMDLRFFIKKWAHILAVKDDSKADAQTPASYSFQFFDHKGAAIEKVFLRDVSEKNVASWETIVETQAATVTAEEVSIDTDDEQSQQPWTFNALDSESLASLHEQWMSMTDVHQFEFILRKLGVDRASSYQQAPEGMTQLLDNFAIETLLEEAKAMHAPIMTFVGNTGVVQIQTGQVHNIKRMGKWINILDKQEEKFTLHLNDNELAQVWRVKRPTKDGIVTCIEGFDNYGKTVVSFFGLRQEGEPEREDWKNIVAKLEQQHA